MTDRPCCLAVIAEARHADWDATLEGEHLDPIAAGWANGFDIPSDLEGRLEVPQVGQAKAYEIRPLALQHVLDVEVVVGGELIGPSPGPLRRGCS